MTLLLATSIVVAAPGAARSRTMRASPTTAFHIAANASADLARLWSASVSAHAERVACIGGQSTDSEVVITRVHEVKAVVADSLGVGAAAPLEQCASPEWLGTTHTHVARLGGIPYVTFSGADRSINTMWRHRWHSEGVFCVLYSDSAGTCEVGERFLDTVEYARPVVAAR
jgi:hypothetical protein